MIAAGQRSGLAPARRLIIRAIAIVSALLLAGAIAYGWTMELLAHGERAQATARQAALSLSTYGRLLAAHAQALAQDAAVPGSSARSAFPGVQSVELIALGPLGIADPALRKEALRNNIEIRLAGRAFNGEKPAAEAYRDNGSWLVIAAAAVAAPGGQAGGVVLVRADLATVARDHLPLAHESGEFSLWSQGADGIYLPVARGGAAPGDTGASYRAATDIRPLYAGFEPASRVSLRLSLGIAALALGAVAAAVLLVALVLRTFRALAAGLDADVATLTDLALRQRHTTATLPALSWHELAGLGDALLQLRRDQPPATQGSATVATRPARAAPDPLEILDEPGEVEVEGEAPLQIPAEIFRDYDIRGRSAQMPPQLAHAIGRAIGSEALDRQCGSIVVGADGRDSSPRLREQLVRGLLSTGIDVIDTGTVATPMLYFACHHLRTMSGVMITGSHNPADHNGFKVMIGGETQRGAGILRLRERIEHSLFHEGQGSYRVTAIDADYIKAVADDVLVDASHKVVIDCGNGAASVIAEDLFRELGCDVVPLFCELDSRFPNHHPDPAVPENLQALIAKVAETGAALGIAFDGDADRIGVVSASGSIVTADRLMMLLVREVLASHPGADVVFDVKCSRDLAAVVRDNGGRPIMCRSGHSWIKEKMKESGALLGGEFTGHICFRDRWFGFDDALYCAARLLELLAAQSRTLDELLAELPRSVATPELRIEMPEEQKFVAMETISRGFALGDARLSRIDGVRAEFADGWGLVRASNTSAALICRFEGRDEATLARIQGAFLAEIRRLLPGTNVSF